MMGLDQAGTNTDDIDGLEIYDLGTVEVVEPGIDYLAVQPLSRITKSFCVLFAPTNGGRHLLYGFPRLIRNLCEGFGSGIIGNH